MFLPSTVDVPMARLPFANWALIGLTCIISIAILLGDQRTSADRPSPELQKILKKLDEENLSDQEYEDALHAAVQHAGLGIPPLALRPSAFSVTQLISHLFVHADLWHLLGNMLFLFVFG